jgi:hypothetical protein
LIPFFLPEQDFLAEKSFFRLQNQPTFVYNKIAFRAASIWYGIDSLESGMYFAPEVVPDVLAKCGFTLQRIFSSVYHFFNIRF